MNGAHLHLMLVHFPIAGTILAFPLLLAGWRMKNESVKLVGLAFVIAVGLLGWAADETGGLAAGIVHNMPDITRDRIHEHAEAADWGLRAMALNGALAAYGLFAAWKNRKLPPWVFNTLIILTLWASTVMARVGYLGGQIHHPETRSGFVAPAENPKP